MLDVLRQYVDAALDLVRKQVEALGLATRDDIDEIKQRLWKLETAAGATEPPAKKPAAKRRPARKPAPRKPATPAVPPTVPPAGPPLGGP